MKVLSWLTYSENVDAVLYKEAESYEFLYI